jgi:catechol 2,3-dioxygenase-like lactoylglutathione lyase family enzyme
VDVKLEVVVLPVSDVDRAKRFYAGLGWREDADIAAGDAFRIVQFTPPGSAGSCSSRRTSRPCGTTSRSEACR